MEKNIKDYLHLYLGCEIKYRVWSTILNKYSYPKEKLTAWLLEHILHSPDHDCPELPLRPLSDMTEEEKKAIDEFVLYMPMNNIADTLKIDAAKTNYLLSKNFDLFGLIDAGLAIDKTKVLTNNI